MPNLDPHPYLKQSLHHQTFKHFGLHKHSGLTVFRPHKYSKTRPHAHTHRGRNEMEIVRIFMGFACVCHRETDLAWESFSVEVAKNAQSEGRRRLLEQASHIWWADLVYSDQTAHLLPLWLQCEILSYLTEFPLSTLIYAGPIKKHARR